MFESKARLHEHVQVAAFDAPSTLASPRRAVVGWDSARLAMVIAVLDARCGLSLAGRDVYLNVAGGLKIGEPAADLAIAGAILSAVGDRPTPNGTVMFGEIGLSGEVRGVSQTSQRLKEATKLGFARAMTPPNSAHPSAIEFGIQIQEIAHLRSLLAMFGCNTDALGAMARTEEVH